MTSLYIAADVHGQHEALQRLADRCGPDDHLVMLGDYIKECDLEAGRTCLRLCEKLETDPQVQLIYGNNDLDAPEWYPSRRFLDQPLRTEKRCEIDGLRLLLTHYLGLPWHQFLRGPKLTACLDQLDLSGVDLLCFGHTHRAFWHRTPGGIYCLNPGALQEECYAELEPGRNVRFFKGYTLLREEHFDRLT